MNDKKELEKKQAGSYPKYILECVEALTKEVEKHVPNIRELRYDEWCNVSGAKLGYSDFTNRMCMALYLEFIRAGLFDQRINTTC